MASHLGLLVALDAVAAALVLVVAAFFIRTWRRTGQGLHLLMGAGFALSAVGISMVSTSQFDLLRTGGAVDAVRFAGWTGGVLVVALAYLSARLHGNPRVPLVAGWVLAASAGLVALLYVLPPARALPSLQESAVVLHAVQFLACLAIVALGVMGLPTGARLDHALVPAAFLAWGFSKYTWLLLDLTQRTDLIPLVYLWRFLGIGLLLLAVALPVPRTGRRADAPS